MKRRSFIKAVGCVAGGYTLGVQTELGQTALGAPESAKVEGLPRRVLGKTGEKLSVVGFPGFALRHYDQETCTAGVHKAFDRGVNYFDVAPAYADGDCEEKMGVALQGIDRDKIFLANKTKMRDKQGARQELERSLMRLKTDHFDLYQMHVLYEPEEVEQALTPDGALETFVKAREEGKIKYLGFSAHTTRSALAALRSFQFDTVMFPISFVEYWHYGFGKAVLDLAAEQGLGVLAIKPLSKGGWPQGAERTRQWWYQATERQSEANLAMNFVLSQKGVVAGIPPSFLDLLDIAVEAGKAYRPMTDVETNTLQAMAKSCIPLFQKRDQRVAMAKPVEHPAYLREGVDTALA